ncbi:hypothetical protein [Streptomyces aurantiogriseus]|uniref:Uncharacterized protein n=1 Tax=Streptomyces aurantiogriseus TaxID=66870 RepID=A0A918FK38_9ACTN|nr:hypothetical protein [Streptomyces aurantiogriseus]GGR44472.1 hypothetical protein GCM10010251_71740 [Streptomyces aurantiogriseus]
MTDQPYGQQYEGQDPYAQQQAWPGQQQQQYGYEDQQAHLQYTQQWQGQTWETSVQPPVAAVDAAETAYLPPQTGEAPVYGGPQTGEASAYGGPQTGEASVYGRPQTGEAPAYGAPQPDAAAPSWQQHQPTHDRQQQAAAYGRQQQAAAYGRQQATHGRQQAPYGDQQSTPAPAPRPEGDGAPSYGPATLAGNARITDAQRARLEGRSPIIEPGMQPAALTALLGLLLSGTAAVGEYALLVPLVVLQAVTAAGWFRLNGMWPARQGIALAFLGALAADAALLVAGREHAPAAILGTLGVWVLLSLVLQLRSHADPDERMYGLMATVASAALAIVATGHLGADPDAVTVGAAAVAVAALARALPLPTPASVAVSLLAAAGTGIAVGGMTDLGTKGALLGAGAALCALIGHRVASYDYPSKFVHFTAGVALPLAAAAPAVYVLGRALG